ncbi:hypothetical protein V4Y02_24160, partial [Escherichia coli]
MPQADGTQKWRKEKKKSYSFTHSQLPTVFPFGWTTAVLLHLFLVRYVSGGFFKNMYLLTGAQIVDV